MESINDELSPDALKPRYETPLLRHLGDIREITLGGSGCTADSGGTMQSHPVVCP
jgi:hypothetical protein